MKTIWSFDLGKASIGEAVRERSKSRRVEARDSATRCPHFPRAPHRAFHYTTRNERSTPRRVRCVW